jgi:hypothetical protein
MTDETVWEKLANSGLALISFRAYSTSSLVKDEEGIPRKIYDEKHFLGIKFVCISANWGHEIKVSLDPNDRFYIYSEDSAGSRSKVGNTPEEAIRKYFGVA